MSRAASDRVNLSLTSAAGNRFHLWDGFQAAPPEDAPGAAVRLCAGGASDGLLLVLPDLTGAADCQMLLYNADGGRAETCGNGLRCVGKRMYESGRLESTWLTVRTDAGVVGVEVFPASADGPITKARVELPTPRERRLLELDALEVENVPNRSIDPPCATFVDLGNPHCVLFGAPELLDELPTLGPRLERHELFPHRANIELATADSTRPNSFTVRVWERGVGETQACGSGAVAVALAAVEAELADWPVAIQMPGGELVIDHADEQLSLTGPVDPAAALPRS